ncbi:unnamed protein product [Eruca vesicaria subsp. sativa]|uniref:TRF2/HOY1 PH-like domain-containing protein n=1 Tax=Eruca vesicaria subsp. sativa TaxID=29727 RepID=A0ABC8KSH9_ERUVS|nr:unnamed protein product [Eruca vesicaria subsp. sativa]
MSLIQTALQQNHSSPHQQNFHHTTEHTKTVAPFETPKNHEKPKAVNSQIHKITIGQWTHVRVYPDDIKAKFYFKKRRIIWEFLDDVEIGTQVERLKRKIEIEWSDVLSFRAILNSHDDTGILEVELGKRPTFFMETNLQARKHTQWKMDQDFTLDQSASKYRRHTLHFFPGDLQETLEKLVSGDSFWSKLAKVKFPTLQSLYFDIGFGDSNNDVGTVNLSHDGRYQTLSFDNDNESIHHYSQGFDQLPDGNVNFNIPTQFYPNDGRQMNSFVQGIHSPWTQVIQPSSQWVEGRYVSEPQFNNSMIQTRNTRELLGNQAYEQALRETKGEYMKFHMEPYLQDYSAQEGETQHMEHILPDGNFHQTNNICYCDQCFSNIYSLPHDLLM